MIRLVWLLVYMMNPNIPLLVVGKIMALQASSLAIDFVQLLSLYFVLSLLHQSEDNFEADLAHIILSE